LRTRPAVLATTALLLLFFAGCHKESAPAGVSASSDSTDGFGPATWTSETAPAEAVVYGGPWTLGQSGAGTGAPSAGYCVNGVQQGNPDVEPMKPYYFPYTVGRGTFLQGYFDYRPKDDDEAIVAATSFDGGQSWVFQQEVLELSTACPKSDADTNGNDDGQGHPYVMTVAGQTFLYTLDRTANNVDSAGLVVHALTPAPDAPLAPTPASFDVTGRTTGLSSPDGILAVVPGSQPTTILYLQKQLGAAQSFAADQQCAAKSPNEDVTTVRLATTDDGVNFIDLGPAAGFNDPTDATPTGTRWVGPRGTLFDLGDRWGLFFTGGNCLDNDSDAFHFIGYAESYDLVNWTVVNGLENPIASVAAVTVNVGGAPTTIPSTAPVVGDAGDWFAGRVYGPSATLLDDRRVVLTFAGYHTIKPKDAYDDYRTVGSAVLRVSSRVRAGSGDFTDP
jgi:hypothetical protein